MAFEIEQELLVREALAGMIGTVPEAGYVVPAAHYFADAADYWAQYDPTKVTQKEIETEIVSATWLYPVNFRDDPTSGSEHSPLKHVTYEIYIFRQYALQREDEAEIPDAFKKLVLYQHNKFIAAWLGIQAAFQRRAAIEALSGTDFVRRESTPVVQIEPIVPQAICEFIPRVIGFAVRLQETVQIQLREC